MVDSVDWMRSVTGKKEPSSPSQSEPTSTRVHSTYHRYASSLVEVIRARSERWHAPVYAYCVMPDHVHLVLGPGSGCDVIRFVGEVKNLTQRAVWAQGFEGRLWQPRFWDRILREEEDVETVVQYVIHNPVRAGLVSEWHEWPASGSWVFDLDR